MQNGLISLFIHPFISFILNEAISILSRRRKIRLNSIACLDEIVFPFYPGSKLRLKGIHLKKMRLKSDRFCVPSAVLLNSFVYHSIAHNACLTHRRNSNIYSVGHSFSLFDLKQLWSRDSVSVVVIPHSCEFTPKTSVSGLFLLGGGGVLYWKTPVP